MYGTLIMHNSPTEFQTKLQTLFLSSVFGIIGVVSLRLYNNSVCEYGSHPFILAHSSFTLCYN